MQKIKKNKIIFFNMYRDSLLPFVITSAFISAYSILYKHILKLFFQYIPIWSALFCIRWLRNSFYHPYTSKVDDSNFVVIDQTLSSPVHHQTLSPYSPFVLRSELPPVKASVALCLAAITLSFFLRIPAILPSVFLRLKGTNSKTNFFAQSE